MRTQVGQSRSSKQWLGNFQVHGRDVKWWPRHWHKVMVHLALKHRMDSSGLPPPSRIALGVGSSALGLVQDDGAKQSGVWLLNYAIVLRKRALSITHTSGGGVLRKALHRRAPYPGGAAQVGDKLAEEGGASQFTIHRVRSSSLPRD